MDAPLRSPLPEAEHRIPPPPQTNSSPLSPAEHRIPQSPHRREPPVSSPLRSPLPEVEHRITQSPHRREPPVSSPLRSPLPEAEHRILPPPQTNYSPLSPAEHRRESPVSSPLRSPLPETEHRILPPPQTNSSLLSPAEHRILPPPQTNSSPLSPAEHRIPQSPHRREPPVSSALRSPLPEAEHRIPSRPQNNSLLSPAEHRIPQSPQNNHSPLSPAEHRIPQIPHPASSPFREEPAVSSRFQSPPPAAENPIPRRNLPQLYQLVSAPSPERSALRTVAVSTPLRPPPQDDWIHLAAEPAEKSVVPPAAVEKPVVQGGEKRRAPGKAAVGLRFLALAFSLVSFSVMAADKTVGWAGDSFDRYKEYRYLVSINVIAFVYSTFQVYAYFHYLITKNYIIGRPIEYYFNFTMDQLLAYLLMSASSSAATRTDAWVSMFGSDDFTDMANGSIAISFLAFVALALSSLISSYNLVRRNA